jgi:hypothetical protein
LKKFAKNTLYFRAHNQVIYEKTILITILNH